MGKITWKKLIGFVSIILCIYQILSVRETSQAISNQPNISVNKLANDNTVLQRDGVKVVIKLGEIVADGEIVFCVDPKIIVKSGSAYHTGKLSDNVIYDSQGYRLTNEQYEMIKSIVFWGWDMSESKDLKQYLIVQGAIYKILGWTFDNLTNDLTIHHVNQFIDNVNKQQNAKVSFDGEQHIIEKGESIVLTDISGMLKYLQFDNQDGWIFQKKGENTLIISATQSAVDTKVDAKPIGNKGNQSSLLLTAKNSQSVILLKNLKKINAGIQLNVKKKGGIRIHKRNALTQENLSGVEFGVFEKEQKVPFVTRKTDDNGIVEFLNLEAGKSFDIKEIKTREKYRLNEETFSIHIKPNHIETINVFNEPKQFRISVQKHLENKENNQQTIAGKDFIFDIISLETNQIVDTLITNDEGRAISKDLPATTSYQLVERESDQYIKSDSIQIDPLDTDNQIYHYDITNKLKRGKVILVKKDLSTQKGLKGVVFKLVAVEEGQNIEVGQYKTDPNGVIELDNLPIGQYFFEEIDPLHGFFVNEDKYLFDVSDSVTEIVVTNEPIPTIITKATNLLGEKELYRFEMIKEEVNFEKLVPNTQYTVVATMFNEQGKILNQQSKKFVPSHTTYSEEFLFDVPKDYSGKIVFGEELLKNQKIVATHIDLTNKDQTINVLRPTIHTLAQVGTNNSLFVGEQISIVDKLVYEGFKNKNVIIVTWLVEYGTNNMIGEKIEQVATLNGKGELCISLDHIESQLLKEGYYTIMEQIFSIDDNNQKTELISEHIDPFDRHQTFSVTKKQLKLPKTGSHQTLLICLLGGICSLISSLYFITKYVF